MRSGLAQFAAGVLLLAIAFAGLEYDWPWVAQPFYAWAWWGWILILDGFCAHRRGESLLTTRRWIVLPMALSSISFWFAFEALNLRFKNWYYVGCYRLDSWDAVLACGVFVVAAFATVFIGIFETIDAVGATGLWRNWRGRQRRIPVRTTWIVQAVGLAMVLLAVLFPKWLAPLVWGSVSLLVDPWNYRKGRHSLLRDVERGEFGRLGRVLVGGLACGIVWESLNFAAPQKWIYTVRGLEGLKLFEMPLLGFLGFPALALDSFSVFALLSSWFFGNRTWEPSADASEALLPRQPRIGWFYLSAPVQVAAWTVIALGVIRINVGSATYPLDEVESLTLESASRLEAAGLGRSRRLLRALRHDPDEVREAADIDAAELRALERELELYEFKGIGPWYGKLLREVGVQEIGDIGEFSVDELHARLAEAGRRMDLWVPREDWVRVWVLASRDRGAWMSSTASR